MISIPIPVENILGISLFYVWLSLLVVSNSPILAGLSLLFVTVFGISHTNKDSRTLLKTLPTYGIATVFFLTLTITYLDTKSFYLSTLFLFVMQIFLQRHLVKLFLQNVNHVQAILILGYYLTPHISQFCAQNFATDFDSQNFIAWIDASHSGLFPGKDIFYPYGLFSYFRPLSGVLSLASILFVTSGVSAFFLTLHRASRHFWFSYISTWLFILVVQQYGNIISFERYGITFLFVMLCCAALIQRVRATSFVLGLLAGLIFTGWIDQGIFSGVIAGVLISYNWLVRVTTLRYSKRLVYELPREYIQFFIGFILGMVPLIFLLVQNDALHGYFTQLAQLGALGMYAKIPFFFVGSKLQILLLFLSVFAPLWILFNFFIRPQRRSDPFMFLLIGLSVFLLLLQQKNIMRPIPEQVIFIAFALFVGIFFDVLTSFPFWLKSWSKYVYAIIFLVFIATLLELQGTILESPQKISRTLLANARMIDPHSGSSEMVKVCADTAFSSSSLPLSREQKQSLEFLSDHSNSSSVFSYPGDPLLYTFLDQTYPPYLNAYDGSPISAQKKQIEYIEKNDVQYVLYSLSAVEIDGIPYAIRSPLLLSSILQNFAPIQQIGKTVILQRSEPTLTQLAEFPEFKEHLALLQLQALAAIQGAERSKQASTVSVINTATIATSSAPIDIPRDQTAGILLHPDKNTVSDQIQVHFAFEDGFLFTTTFWNCFEDHPCDLRFSQLPFVSAFREQLSSVTFDNFTGNAVLYEERKGTE